MSEKDRDLKCSWDGDITTFPDYVRRVRLAFEKTRRRRRKQLGPDLVSQLTGRAWVITQEIDHQRLVQADGARYLVDYLEERLARVPIPDAGARAEELLVKLRRPPGMSMATWCATIRESYRKLQRALKRARPTETPRDVTPTPTTPAASPVGQAPRTPPHDRPGSTSTSPSRRSRRASKETVQEPEQMPTPERPSASGERQSPDDEAGDGEGGESELPVLSEEDDEADEDALPFRQGFRKGLGKAGQWQDGQRGKSSKRKAEDSSESETADTWGTQMWEDLDTGLPEVLPTEILGWLMLRRCNLSAQQRLNVLSSIGNSLRAEDVEQGLRGAEDELRLHDQDHGRGKGKGGRMSSRPNFWIEKEGEWGLLADADVEALEDSLEDVHWIGKDINSVYMSSTPKPSASTAEPSWAPSEEGYWYQDESGDMTYWTQHTDGEFYTMDNHGIYWTWDELQEDAAWWSSTPEQQKELAEAYAAYESKMRTFTESRQLMKNKGASRGFYGKSKGKGKSKKGKGKPSTSSTPSGPSTAFGMQPAEAYAAVGSKDYTGCFICGNKYHDFRSCPNRGRNPSSSSGKGKGGKIFMLDTVNVVQNDEELGLAPSPRPTSIHGDAWMAEISDPHLRGHAVLDTGATETVTSLAALEAIHHRRTELLGHSDHIEVVPGPCKVFRFGNGMTQSSESFVNIKQQVGSHEIKLGAYTIDATGVPLLLGIRTLERLGAILDTKQGFLVMKTVDPTLIIPLKRSPTGHLLLDLCSNWLDGGAKILFQTEVLSQPSEEKAFTVVGMSCETSFCSEGDEVRQGSDACSTSTPTAPHFCADNQVVHTFTYNRSCDVTVAVEDVFVSFDETKLTYVQEDEVQFQNMSNTARPLQSDANAPQQSEDQDRAMSLRIIALLASSSVLTHGAVLDQGNFQGDCETQGAMGDQVRCIPHSGTRRERSSLCGSSMLRQPCDCQGRPWQPNWVQRPRFVGGMREVPPADVLHSSLRSTQPLPEERPSASRHGRDGEQAGTQQLRLQRQDEGPLRGIGCSGEVSRKEVGVRESHEGSMEQAAGEATKFDSEAFGTDTNATGDASSSFHRRDAHHSRKEDTEAGASTGGSGIFQPRRSNFVGSSQPTIISTVKKDNYEIEVDPKFDVQDFDNPAIMDEDHMAAYDFNMEVEDAWMEDVVYEKMAETEIKHLKEMMTDYINESEECFHAINQNPEETKLDLMELCCEKESLLSHHMIKSGGTAFRAGLHNGFDLMTEHGTQMAINAVNRLKPRLLWVSFPCGPTSPIQALNERTPEGLKKSRERIRRSKKLVRNGIKVMNAQILAGGQIVQEWPRHNRAWFFPEICDFWQAMQQIDRYEDVHLDGCCYGLQVPEGLLRKPWRFRCSQTGVFSSLARQCDGRHKHVPTMGGTRTKKSALYTPRLCQAVCHAYHNARNSGEIFGALEINVDRDGLKTMTEQELQHISQTVLKLHRLCGHPSNRALMKTLAARGADGRTLAVAEKLNCSECLENQMSKPSVKVALDKEEVIWRTMQMDTFFFRYGDQVHHYLLMLDEASGFAVVKEFAAHGEEEHQNISTATTIQIIQESWIQYFGMPHRIRCDLEGAFRGDQLQHFCRERGIELTQCPAEHHESIGEVERNVGELKKKMAAYLRNESEVPPGIAATEMCGAHNRIARIGGYAPNQWAFGRDIEERENLALNTAQGDPASELHRSLQVRLRAESRYRELQAKARISRALNSKVQRSSQFLPGDLIYYKRYKTPADNPAHSLLDTPSMKISRFFGPGRVLAAETKVDEDGITRSASNVIWIVSQGRLKKVHSSQLRHASTRERLISEATEAPTMPWTFTSLGRFLNKGEFEDLTKPPPRRGRPPGSLNKTLKFKVSRTALSTREKPKKEPIQPEMVESDEELIPADDAQSSGLQAGQLPHSGEGLQPEGELQEEPPTDLDLDRLLEDPKYMPMRMIDDEELKRRRTDFANQRRLHEQLDRPLHVRQATSSSTRPADAMASNFWMQDETENDIFGVIIDMPKDESEWKKVLKNPAKFAAKSVSKGAEVAWHKLNPEQRKAMAEAKQLEVSQWVQQKVCERFKGVIPKNRLMRTRWVLVFKSVDDDETKVKCKARIVLLGYTDPDLGSLDTAAPTLSRRSRQLTLSLSTLRRWKTYKADAKSAFLQGRETQKNRDIFIVPVSELSESLGIPPGEGARMLKAAYGLVSAPREWFGEVDEVASNKCKMNRLKTDPCVWIKQDPTTGRTIGYFASHVDDFLVAGEWDNPLWIETVEIFKRAFVWSPWEEESYAHCGVSLTQNADFSFTFNHANYVEQIKQIDINDKEDKITKEEMSQARAVLGAIQWRAIQSGPQHSAKLSWLQSALPHGNKDTLHQINKLCRECHSQRFQSIAVKNLGIQRDEDVAFVCFTDAAVGNRPDLSSTGGYLVGMCDAAFLRGQRGVTNPISWRSGKLARVARSSLSAEIQALGDGEQELMFVRAEWAELTGHALDLRKPEKTTSQIPGAVVIDAKSVYDAFYKGEGASSAFSLKEKYAALDLLAISENLRRQNTPLLWVASDAQLADGLA